MNITKELLNQNKMKKTKNSTPSSEWEPKDRCPSCGNYCDIHKDLDENDECNDCRDRKPLSTEQ
jgi:hypothetical protein